MTNKEFVNKLSDIRKNYKTAYAKGTFGQKATDSFIEQKKKQYPIWYTKARVSYLKSLPDDARLFDCVGLGKAVLWGFPNIVYTSNGVPDMNDDMMWKACYEQSKDFSNIEIGEVLWLKGHVGFYIGNGKAIECTTNWSGNVQITAVLNIGKISGLNGRKWTGHGKLKYITYEEIAPKVPETQTETPKTSVYYVKKGDTLSGIAKANGLSLAKLVSYNPQIRDINKINVGDKIYLTSQAKEEYYIVQKGDTLGAIARKFNIALNELLGLNPDIKNPNLIHIGDKIRVK